MSLKRDSERAHNRTVQGHVQLLKSMGWKNVELAVRLGIGRACSGRYMGVSSSRRAARHRLFPARPPTPALARVASLGVETRPSCRSRRDPELARPMIEAALLDMAEKLDAGPIRCVAHRCSAAKHIEAGSTRRGSAWESLTRTRWPRYSPFACPMPVASAATERLARPLREAARGAIRPTCA